MGSKQEKIQTPTVQILPGNPIQTLAEEVLMATVRCQREKKSLSQKCAYTRLIGINMTFPKDQPFLDES